MLVTANNFIRSWKVRYLENIFIREDRLIVSEEGVSVTALSLVRSHVASIFRPTIINLRGWLRVCKFT
ncbi:hypothetical protein C453_19465 [Haloferax elongans ATCC BAA-1513]|uniref:Uncharacterized protein n=1 Tax=Haloferax elongans ATCC BAA-1513 TaxID=1230453 RepID=M0H720_HALEO|nr:hypothetical protein C453_19465 [Haloferax elongans ATCC BAA-1513]